MHTVFICERRSRAVYLEITLAGGGVKDILANMGVKTHIPSCVCIHCMSLNFKRGRGYDHLLLALS